MKALSLTQPWAQLMADGRKHNETRSWEAFERWIGQDIAIHAAKSWTPRDVQFASQWHYDADTLPRGAIVAVVRLYDCAPSRGFEPGLEEAYGDYTPGRWIWLTKDPRKLATPIPCRGALGLWDLPPDVEAEVRAQLRAVPA